MLWSHYAERHLGASLGFDVADEDLRLVDYTAERLELPRADGEPVKPEVVDRLIVTKYPDWNCEQEARVVVPLHGLVREGVQWFRPFDDRLVLREQRLGARCTLSLDQARRRVEPLGGDIRVSRTRLASQAFRIVDAPAGERSR